jgi:hypothetical protein
MFSVSDKRINTWWVIKVGLRTSRDERTAEDGIYIIQYYISKENDEFNYWVERCEWMVIRGPDTMSVSFDWNLTPKLKSRRDYPW